MIELHLHLDGSIPKETYRSLKEMNGEQIGNTSPIILSMKKGKTGLVDYLKCFDEPIRLLQNEEGIKIATYSLIKQLYKENIKEAELRFAPQLLKMNGLRDEEIVEAVLEGKRKAILECPDMNVGFLLCMMVNGNEKDNLKTVEIAKRYLGSGVIGIDLAGPEGMYSLDNFRELFRKASSYHIPYTIHAGECKDYSTIEKAIDLGASRIGHGIAAIYSEKCMNLLINKRIPIEVCVTSNVQTCAVDSYESHPIKKLLDAGVVVTINSDNRTVSDTNLNREIEIVKEKCGISEDDIEEMQRYAKNATFL